MSDGSVCVVTMQLNSGQKKGAFIFSPQKWGATLVGTPDPTQLTASWIPSPGKEVVRADNVLCFQCLWY
jgi:hypothetical protein